MYYVYGLLDPRDNTLFYVGKGQGSRTDQHLVDARHLENNTEKDRRINEIEAANAAVRQLIFVKEIENEYSAYLVESLLLHQAETGNVWNFKARLTNLDPGHHRDRFRPMKDLQHTGPAVQQLPQLGEFEFTGKKLKEFREQLFDDLRPLFNRVIEEIPEFETASKRTTDYLNSEPIPNGNGTGFEFVVYCRSYRSVEFQYFHRAQPTEEQIAHSISIADELGLKYNRKEAKVRETTKQLSLLDIDDVIEKLKAFIASVKALL